MTSDTYKNIAEHCSSYACCEKCYCSNKAGDSDVSCTTCKHFTSERRCELDLIDPIVENHNF